ncbi:MAG: hypothetical protein ACM3JP_00405, partial [Betaproteobacteria bacterium]
MGKARAAGVATVAVLALCGALASPAAAGQHTSYRGQFLCNDRGVVEPLGGMNVELWKRGWDWLPVEISGSQVKHGYTAPDGSFNMTSPTDDDNYFVRMALRDARHVHLKDFLGINDWSVDTAQTHNDQPVRDYGGIEFVNPDHSPKCAIWAGVHAANDAFLHEVGTELPSHGVEIDADAVTAGVPFSPYTSIWWPGGFPVGYRGGGDASITWHEYGHVLRAGFDGDLGHFLGDVVTHNYLQTHETCNHTGPGFAFNEGWAEYWAQDFGPAPDCGRPGDMETEGNVAAALSDLANRCASGQRKLMVEVLRSNPGTIHSFAEFQAAMGCPLPPASLVPPTLPLALIKPASPVSAKARAGFAKLEVVALGKRIGKLSSTLKVDLRRASNPPPCVKRPCLALLKALTRPAGVKFELDLARLQRQSAGALDSKAEQNHLLNMDLGKLISWKAKREARERHKVILAALGASQGVLKAARPVFHLDHSKLITEFRGDISAALARFRHASRHGGSKLPPSLTLLPAPFELPHKVPRVPSPTPPSQPTPAPTGGQVGSTLTLDTCPVNTASPKPIEVGGTLTPAQAGSKIQVTFSYPGIPASVVDVTTDSSGKWTASHTPDPTQSGTWIVT